MHISLSQLYHAYLACLNARDWEKLGGFVADDAIHNGRPLGLTGYRVMLEQNCRDIPDLRFDDTLVVVDGDHIAARLRFNCTPMGEFLGLPVNGRRVVFHEHAIYHVSDGKIAEVFSIIDIAAIASQLRS